MKNKILAILMIMVIFVSMIPINAFAATTTTETGIEWVKKSINGTTYKIEYWHPKGFENIKITNRSTSSNWKHYYITYYSDSAQFTGKNNTSITNSIIISMNQNGYSYMSPYIQDVEKDMMNLVFMNDATYRNKTFTKIDTTDGSTHQYTGTDIMDVFLDSKDANFETSYVNWYYETYGFYPPLISDFEDENVEFMIGNYYAILSQETIITNEETFEGYVETVDYVKLKSKTMTNINGKNRGLVYVVISSEDKAGDLIGTSIADDGILDWVIGSIGKLGVWLDMGTRRNNYNITNYMFYNNKTNLNRYYCNSIQDACKFVLYGTAGAKYLYKETGKTDFGYGYVSCEYNNYDLNGFTEKKIPEVNYPLGRQELILMQHDVIGEGRKFLHIELNYYSRASMVDPDYKLIINNKYLIPTYLEYTQGNQEFNPLDKTIYTLNKTYAVPSSQTFQLYYEGMTDTKNTWDIIYSTYNIYQSKKGQIVDGDESEPLIKVWIDKDGNVVVENSASGEAFKNGDIDPYKQNENGEWIDKDGNKWDKENYTNEVLEWQKTLKDYQNEIEKLADLIEDFTIFINDSAEQVKEITGLLNAVMLSFPSIFRTLILISTMALVFARVIKRKGA